VTVVHSGAGPPDRRGEFITVRPARPVWVNLGAAFRIRQPRQHVPYGLDLQAIVPGELNMWALTTTGNWVGHVSFVVQHRDHGIRTSQWILQDALRPRLDTPDQPGQRGSSGQSTPHIWP
jgi:hypothetical protein